MKTIKQLLDENRREVVTVSPDDSVFEALERMAKHDIGAVVATQGGKIAGIFTERDYARKIILHGKASRETRVREIMTENVCCIAPDRTVDEGLALMSDKRCRHLPVLDDGMNMIGLVSIGDLVKEIISEQRFVIEQLESYING